MVCVVGLVELGPEYGQGRCPKPGPQPALQCEPRVPQYLDTWMADSLWSAGLLTISGDEGRMSATAGGFWRCVFPAQRGCSEVIRNGMGTLQAEKSALRVRRLGRLDDGSGGAGQGHVGHAAGLAGDPRPR